MQKQLKTIAFLLTFLSIACYAFADSEPRIYSQIDVKNMDNLAHQFAEDLNEYITENAFSDENITHVSNISTSVKDGSRFYIFSCNNLERSGKRDAVSLRLYIKAEFINEEKSDMQLILCSFKFSGPRQKIMTIADDDTLFPSFEKAGPAEWKNPEYCQ